MEINEIIEQLKYYTGELPKEALKQAIQQIVGIMEEWQKAKLGMGIYRNVRLV